MAAAAAAAAGWQILMHSTPQWNLHYMVKSGGIDIIGDHDDRKDYPGSAPGVYFHYLFEGMKNQAYMMKRSVYWNYGEWPTNGSTSITLCFRMDLLKDLAFRVCDHMNAGCYARDQRTMIQKPGNLKRVPDLRVLREHIDAQMEAEAEGMDRRNGTVYVSSHEIVVLKRVPIRYLAYVLVRGRRTRLHLEKDIDKVSGGRLRVPIIDTIYLYRHMRVKHWVAQCAAMAYMAKHAAAAAGQSNEAIMDAIVADAAAAATAAASKSAR